MKRILPRNPTNWTTGGDPVRECPPKPGYIDGPAGISHSQGNRGRNTGVSLTNFMETICFVIRAAYLSTGLLACDLAC